MINMAVLILKTKLSADFKLRYIKNFQNNFLSMLDKATQAFFTLVPSQAHPALEKLKNEYDKS